MLAKLQSPSFDCGVRADVIVFSFLGLMFGHGLVTQRSLQADNQLVRTPIYHRFPSQHCYVAVTSTGAAAIHLSTAEQRSNKTGNGVVAVRYRWRYLALGEKKETTGSGKLFAKLTDGKTTGGQLEIKAGPIRLHWNFTGTSRGTLAYNPRQIWLHPVNAERFEAGAENREGPVPLAPFLIPHEKAAAQDIPQQDVAPEMRVSAPIPYENCALVVASESGIAAIRLKENFEKKIDDKETHRGIEYDWRYTPATDASEKWKGPLQGSASVYEKYIENVYRNGELHFKAGDIELNWSMGGSQSGWIYYDVRKVRVWTVESADLDSLLGAIETPSQRTPLETVHGQAHE